MLVQNTACIFIAVTGFTTVVKLQGETGFDDALFLRGKTPGLSTVPVCWC